MSRAREFFLVLAVLLLAGVWVYRGHGGNEHSLTMALKQKDDSLKTAIQVRDSVEDAIGRLEQYADQQHETAALADRRADSLTRIADRYRTFRLRVIDSLHVGVTSDSNHVEEVHEVPIEITEQLALDSAALRAQDDRAEIKSRELAVRMTEIGAYKKAMAMDTVAIRQLEGKVDVLEAAKTPRFTFKQGVVIGGVLALTAKLLVALLVH